MLESYYKSEIISLGFPRYFLSFGFRLKCLDDFSFDMY